MGHHLVTWCPWSNFLPSPAPDSRLFWTDSRCSSHPAMKRKLHKISQSLVASCNIVHVHIYIYMYTYIHIYICIYICMYNHMDIQTWYWKAKLKYIPRPTSAHHLFFTHPIWPVLSSTASSTVSVPGLDQNVAPAQDVPRLLLRGLADVGGDPFEAHDGKDHLPNTWRWLAPVKYMRNGEVDRWRPMIFGGVAGATLGCWWCFSTMDMGIYPQIWG